MASEPDFSYHSVEYPKDLCEPKELLTFIQLKGYTDAFITLRLTDDEQRKIEVGIMMHPTLPRVIDGTGYIREFQFSTPKNSPGSFHLSAFYIYFPEQQQVVLIDLFETADVGEMPPVERAALKEAIEEVQRLMGG